MVGPLSDDAIAVCQEKAEQLDVDLHAFQKDFGIEQDRFWNESVELVLPSLGLKGDYQRENAAVALEAFLLYMEGLASRSGYRAGQARLARDTVAGTSRVVW